MWERARVRREEKLRAFVRDRSDPEETVEFCFLDLAEGRRGRWRRTWEFGLLMIGTALYVQAISEWGRNSRVGWIILGVMIALAILAAWRIPVRHVVASDRFLYLVRNGVWWGRPAGVVERVPLDQVVVEPGSRSTNTLALSTPNGVRTLSGARWTWGLATEQSDIGDLERFVLFHQPAV